MPQHAHLLPLYLNSCSLFATIIVDRLSVRLTCARMSRGAQLQPSPYRHVQRSCLFCTLLLIVLHRINPLDGP